MNNDYQTHVCEYNTAGSCGCGARIPEPHYDPGTALPLQFPETVSPPTIIPPLLLLTPFFPPMTKLERFEPIIFAKDKPINGGSPIGPGFVVYEREPCQYGYDLKMAKGSVGPGWTHLIEAFFQAKEHHTKYNPRLGWQDVVVIQVKEKFGQLRIYTHTTTPAIDGYIEALESVSVRTCEACGSPGKLRKRAWMLTLCDAHHKMPTNILREILSPTEQTNGSTT